MQSMVDREHSAPAKASKPRKPNSERRADTLRKILDAGITVLVKKGYANFTTSNVAFASGVSRGAQLTNFATKKELLIATAKFALGEASKVTQAFADDAVLGPGFLLDFVNHVQRLSEGRLGIAMFEIVIAMRTDPELRDAFAESAFEHEAWSNSVWRDLLVKYGYSAKDAEAIVEITTNLMQGVAIHTNRGPKAYKPKVGAHWREILITAFPPPSGHG